MSSNDEPKYNDKPRESAALARARIKKAMAEHLRDYGNDDWWGFRERPDHTMWIGKAEGDAGDRRFYRWKEKVQRVLPTSRTRPHADPEVNEEQLAWAHEQMHRIAPNSTMPVPLSPRHIMRDGRTTLNGFAELGERLFRGFADIERSRQAAVVDDPDGFLGQSASDPKLLLKTVQANREQAQACLSFFERYNAIWALENFQHDLMILLSDKLAAQPDLYLELTDDIEALVHKHGGVPQTAA